MLVPLASRPLAPALVIVVEPKSAVPALLSSTPVALLFTTRFVMLNVPDVPLSSRPACAGGAGVDDVDVVDRAADVARAAGDAAARALRVDGQPTHLVAAVQVDHVGVR